MANTSALKEPIERARIDFPQLHHKYHDLTEGALPAYIPELTKVDTSHFGLAIVTAKGEVFSTGQADVKFPMESISKPFVYALALKDHGREELKRKVGVHATGLPFDSIIDSAIRKTRLQNPLGNAGAMATTSLIKGKDDKEKWERVVNFFGKYIGRTPKLNSNLYESEMATNDKNRSLAYLYKSYGLFFSDVNDAVARYTKACSLMISTSELAIMGATLANGGVHPSHGARLSKQSHVRDVLSVMLIYGLYDKTGDWIFDVGLPGKSGVGGGILAVLPGQFALAAFSPLLDDSGNSVRGIAAIRELAYRWKLHLLS